MRVLTNRDVKPSGRVLRLCPAFCLREARWWLQLEVRKTRNLHYIINTNFSERDFQENFKYVNIICLFEAGPRTVVR